VNKEPRVNDQAETVASAEFIRRFAESPALRAEPAACAHHADLTARASACSYCGVGCSFIVKPNDYGVDETWPLGPLPCRELPS
jgi:hypothetical protein